MMRVERCLAGQAFEKSRARFGDVPELLEAWARVLYASQEWDESARVLRESLSVASLDWPGRHSALVQLAATLQQLWAGPEQMTEDREDELISLYREALRLGLDAGKASANAGTRSSLAHLLSRTAATRPDPGGTRLLEAVQLHRDALAFYRAAGWRHLEPSSMMALASLLPLLSGSDEERAANRSEANDLRTAARGMMQRPIPD